MKSARTLLFMLMIGVVCGACSRSLFISDNDPSIAFTIASTKATNCGTPLYVLLKFTDFPQFLMDDYATVADFSLTCPTTDSSSFLTLCIIPGKTERIIVKPPPGQFIAIYCLFTHYEERWKQLIDPCEGHQEVTILLGEQEISSVTAL